MGGARQSRAWTLGFVATAAKTSRLDLPQRILQKRPRSATGTDASTKPIHSALTSFFNIFGLTLCRQCLALLAGGDLRGRGFWTAWLRLSVLGGCGVGDHK